MWAFPPRVSTHYLYRQLAIDPLGSEVLLKTFRPFHPHYHLCHYRRQPPRVAPSIYAYQGDEFDLTKALQAQTARVQKHAIDDGVNTDQMFDGAACTLPSCNVTFGRCPP